MRKALIVIASCGLLALEGFALIGSSGASGGVTNLARATASHDATHTLEEKVFSWADPTEESYRPYWKCKTCCESDNNILKARYDYRDKTKMVTWEDIRLAPLSSATAEDIADGDEIKNINASYFRRVDQCVNGVDADDKGNASTPVYVKDKNGENDVTAIYFSRSGKSARSGAQNTNLSEFRFTAPYKAVKSVSFSYRYENFSDAYWNYGNGIATKDTSEPATNWTALAQFKESSYYGVAINLTNDGAWHTITINYADARSSGDSSSALDSFVLKFVDLCGYIMISDLKYEEAATTVSLYNTSATETAAVTEKVTLGSLPQTPSIDGKKFLGWYDDDGNKVDAVASSTTKLTARWGVPSASSDYTVTEILKTMNADSGVVSSPAASNTFDADSGAGVVLHLQKGNDTSNITTDFDITLPAFDYNAAGRVDFTLDNNYGYDSKDNSSWGTIKVGDNSFVYSSIKRCTANAYVISDGTNASFYIEGTLLKTFDEDVSSGEKGLSFTFVRETFNTYQALTIGHFKRHNLDYIAQLDGKAASLPSTIEDEDAAITSYKEYASSYASAYQNMTSYEKANYVSEKATTLKGLLSGKTTNLVTIPTTSNAITTWKQANEYGFYSDATSYGPLNNATGFIWLWVQNNQTCDKDPYYFDMPKINYAAFSKVTFKMFSNGAPKITADGQDWVSSFTAGSSSAAVTVTIATSEGKTTISCDYGKAELSDEVAKGVKALRFIRYRSVAITDKQYDNIGFSSFTATF